MSNFLDQENCSLHNQTCVAIDITSQVDAEKRFLCVQCLVDKLSFNNAVLLNNEAVIMLKEIKQKQFERQKFDIEQCLQNYQTSMTKIQDFMDWQNGCLNKILVQFNSQIESLQNGLNQLKEPKVEELVTSVMPVLYQNLNEQNSLDLQQISENNQEKMKQFFIQIEKQLQSIISEDKIQQILNHVNGIINETETKKELIEQRVENCFNSTKTPFLQHVCSKHGKEIIMFVINEEYEKEKLVCVDCIPNVTIKLTILEEVNKMWLIHQGEIYDSNYEFLNGRVQTQQKIQLIISKSYEKVRMLQIELMQLIENQNKDIKSQLVDQELSKNKQQLMQLDQKEIKNVINLLAKNDRICQAKEFQMKIKLEDQEYQNEIIRKLNGIEQVQQHCRQELFKLFDVNDLLLQDTQIQLDRFQKDIDNFQLNSGLFTHLIPKFQNELQQSLLILIKRISDQGHKYIEQMSKADSIIKDKGQDQINIIKYQEVLCQFDSQFKEKVLSINMIETSQIKYKINKFELKDQQSQTNKTLNISSITIIEPKKLIRQKSFQISQQLQTKWSYLIYNANQLKFSTVFKHKDITISAYGKTAKSTTSDDWYLCLCDQPIPKNGTVVVDFKVKYLSWLMAGVSLIDNINKDYGNSIGIDVISYIKMVKFVLTMTKKNKVNNNQAYEYNKMINKYGSECVTIQKVILYHNVILKIDINQDQLPVQLYNSIENPFQNLFDKILNYKKKDLMQLNVENQF